MKKQVRTRKREESQFGKTLDTWLGRMPSVLWHTRLNSGIIQTIYGSWVKLAKKGTPDYIALVVSSRGIAHVLFIELKSNAGKQSLEQKWFEQSVAGPANVHYIVAKDVLTVLNKINDIFYFEDDEEPSRGADEQ